jgi:hypothetical protein
MLVQGNPGEKGGRRRGLFQRKSVNYGLLGSVGRR